MYPTTQQQLRFQISFGGVLFILMLCLLVGCEDKLVQRQRYKLTMYLPDGSKRIFMGSTVGCSSAGRWWYVKKGGVVGEFTGSAICEPITQEEYDKFKPGLMAESTN